MAGEEAWNEGYAAGYNAPHYELDTNNYWEDNPYTEPFPSDYEACGKGTCASAAKHEGECGY